MKKSIDKRPFVFAGLAVLLAAGAAYGIRYGSLPEKGSAIQEQTVTIPSSTAAEEEQIQIVLSQNGTTVTGKGAGVSGNTVRVSQGGTYFISGSLEEGQLYVDVSSDENVFLRFAGISISNTSDAAVYIENAKNTVIVLEDGTENRLQSGKSAALAGVDDSADETRSGAALYARDDLSITGTGSLEVFGYINNGIHTTNHLIVENGTVSIEAQNNGLKGKDSVSISGGDFTIVSGGDGIKSDDTTGEGYGTVSISGGTFSIDSKSDAVQAETELDISGGTFTVMSGEGSENVAFSSGKGWGTPDSDWDITDESETSTKGFKSGVKMQITGGEFYVDSRDDAFHSNGSIQISGGTFDIATGDDGMHADTELTIADGKVEITSSYEGLEGNQILISGGEVSVTASDDGINAYGGQGGRGWGGSGKTTEETPDLNITGGTVLINAEGDGLDSNGDLTVAGGVVIVDGPSDSRNGALDSGSENGGSCVVNGGTVLAVGSSGMAETFEESSRQYSFIYNFDTAFGPGDEITVTDSQGNILFSHVAVKEGNSVVFSCPELAHGETYGLDVAEQSVEVTLDSVSTRSGQAGRTGRDGRDGRSGWIRR